MFAFPGYLTGTNTFRLFACFGRRQYLRPQGGRAHYNTMPNAEDRWHVTLTLFTNSFPQTCTCAQTHKPQNTFIFLKTSQCTGAAFTAQVGNPVQWCTSSKRPHHQVHGLFYNELKHKHGAILYWCGWRETETVWTEPSTQKTKLIMSQSRKYYCRCIYHQTPVQNKNYSAQCQPWHAEAVQFCKSNTCTSLNTLNGNN